MLGYFIETPATHAERMLSPPLAELFVHRQTTANALRFTTLALAEIETKILNAGGHALEIERRIFERPARRRCWMRPGAVGAAAQALAEIDLASALADLARAEDWVRPEVGDGRAFRVAGGRHPVVEQALRRTRRQLRRQRLRRSAPTGRRRGRSGWSPGRTWRASRPSCGRTR